MTLFDDFEQTDIIRGNFQVQHYAFLNTSSVPEEILAQNDYTLNRTQIEEILNHTGYLKYIEQYQ